MIRIAELAPRVRAECLVTGDSLGQVPSQTLSNLTTSEQASPLPFLRPCWPGTRRRSSPRRAALAPPPSATRSDPPSGNAEPTSASARKPPSHR
jgi:hypothetical protein